MADLSTLLPDADVLWEGDNVIELPNLVSGPLADLLAAAGAHGDTGELAGEATMRDEFRVAASEWPSSRRHPRRASAACAASLVAGMILATTGLAAATGLPLPTTHLVDQAINQFNHDLASPPASVPLTGLRHGLPRARHHPVVHGGDDRPCPTAVPAALASACPLGHDAAGGSATHLPAGSFSGADRIRLRHCQRRHGHSDRGRHPCVEDDGEQGRHPQDEPGRQPRDGRWRGIEPGRQPRAGRWQADRAGAATTGRAVAGDRAGVATTGRAAEGDRAGAATGSQPAADRKPGQQPRDGNRVTGGESGHQSGQTAEGGNGTGTSM